MVKTQENKKTSLGLVLKRDPEKHPSQVEDPTEWQPQSYWYTCSYKVWQKRELSLQPMQQYS